MTLVSGHKVTLRADQVMNVTDAQGEPAQYETRRLGDKQYVVPLDAAPALARGDVDDELFDVTALVAMGYDDAHTPQVPLLATFADEKRTTNARTLPGSATDRTFGALHTRALHTPKERAGEFWKAFTRARAERSADAPRKLWLDGRQKVLLDESVPQTGAPEAWAAGYSGKGVTVAVLDTGADATHPDLDGRISGGKDFTGKGDTTDGHGHGTHVASTVAGSGAASDGRHRGMAPDARLLVGKVLSDEGSGQDSWILAGMQWAVDEGADIVSMSLGADTAGACDSPLAQAVNQFSEGDGPLFVLAAGNAGPGASSVGSPGCAKDALTVAAADRELATATFSSRGDVHDAAGAHWAKPDITAPGVGIVAARASGTSMGTPVDDRYTSANGTSMATPHVAGAAALLAQEHPDWSGQRIKRALTSAVRTGAEDVPLAQGAGFIDVGRAGRTRLTGPAALDGGTFAWPHHDGQTAGRTLTWTNEGDDDITLHLATDAYDAVGKPAPAAMVSLKSDTLTVPAHDSASTEVTFSAQPQLSDDGYGEITGRVVATAGDEHTTTAFGFYDQPHMVELTFQGTNRAGDPAGLISYADLLSTGRATVQRAYFAKGRATVTVRAGVYDLDAMIYGFDEGVTEDSLYRTTRSLAAFFRPRQRYDADAVIELDGRTAHRVRTSGDHDLESRTGGLMYRRSFDGLAYTRGVTLALPATSDIAVATTGDDDWKDAGLTYVTRSYAPLLDLRTERGRRLDALYGQYSAVSAEGVTYLDDRGRAGVADVGTGTADELAAAKVDGRMVLVDLGDSDQGSVQRLAAVLTDVADRGARGVLVTHGFAGTWRPFTATAMPVLGITRQDAAALRAGIADGHPGVRWTGTPHSPYVYNLAFPVRPGKAPEFTVRDRDLTAVRETWYSQVKKTDMGDTVAVSTEPGVPATVVGLLQQLDAPSSRWARYSTGTGWVHLGSSSSSGSLEIMAGPLRRWSRPVVDTESWYRGPISPRAPYSTAEAGARAVMGARQGNSLQAAVPTFGDADGHYAYPALNDGVKMTLKRGGEVVAGTVSPPAGKWTVPTGKDRYELSVTDTRNLAVPAMRDWKLSPTTTTVWGFTSGASDDVTALPLLVPNYRAAVDGYNRAPAARMFPVVVSAEGQAGYEARATSASAEYSVDDGTTWKAAKTVHLGSTFTAIVDNSAAGKGGFVSLRLRAAAADGSTVTQTVIRAYAVR